MINPNITMKKALLIFLAMGLFVSCNQMNTSEEAAETNLIAVEEISEEQAYIKPQTKQSPKPLVYYNERFDFTIKYPNNFGQYRESDNGDGMTVYSQNGSMLMRAYASLNLFEEKDIYAIMETLKGWKIDEGCKITYQFSKGKTIVLSGHTKGGLIFYEKNVLYSVAGNDYIATVYYEYPESEKEVGDEAIALIGNFPRQ